MASLPRTKKLGNLEVCSLIYTLLHYLQVKRDLLRSVLLGLKHLHQRKQHSTSFAEAINVFIVGTLDGNDGPADDA